MSSLYYTLFRRECLGFFALFPPFFRFMVGNPESVAALLWIGTTTITRLSEPSQFPLAGPTSHLIRRWLAVQLIPFTQLTHERAAAIKHRTTITIITANAAPL